MTVVCIPDSDARNLLGALPEDIEVIVWDGGGEKPPRLAETVFWVPQVEDSTNLAEKFAVDRVGYHAHRRAGQRSGGGVGHHRNDVGDPVGAVVRIRQPA